MGVVVAALALLPGCIDQRPSDARVTEILQEEVDADSPAEWIEMNVLAARIVDWRAIDEGKVEAEVEYELEWKRSEEFATAGDSLEIARRQKAFAEVPERLNEAETLKTTLIFARWNNGWRAERGDIPFGEMIPATQRAIHEIERQ